jgi:hypothetical protein
MRAFAAACPERQIVQHSVAQLSWRQNLALIEKLANSDRRLWYAAKTLEHGWSSNILALQIDAQAHRRHGKAQTNFPATLPPSSFANACPDAEDVKQLVSHLLSFSWRYSSASSMPGPEDRLRRMRPIRAPTCTCACTQSARLMRGFGRARNPTWIPGRPHRLRQIAEGRMVACDCAQSDPARIAAMS